MPGQWQLQDAKNRLSQVVESARKEGPQTITVRGKPAAVVLSVDDYYKLDRKPERLSEFFAGSPLSGVELDITRSQEQLRDLEL